MRQSKIPFKTLRNVSSDIKLISHKLLFQAWFIRESVAWRYYYLPFGLRVRDKIVKVIEEEMDKTGALRLLVPTLHPIELWRETNRTESVGFELMTVKDRNNWEFVLGWTGEEMMVDLVRKFIISYKDLPFNIYQFSQKFRDEMRARWWLLRVREFLMKDAYSFHASEEDFKLEYKKMRDTYLKIFNRFGLNPIPVEADGGYIWGDYCHEFLVESDVWEDRYFVTQDWQYWANEEVAKFLKEDQNLKDKEQQLIKVDAKRWKTMEEWVKFHNLPLWQQIKDVLFVNEKNKFILAIIRWDLDVNETKLAKLTNSANLRMATDEEVRSLWTEPGFISPVDINSEVFIVADDSLRTIKNAYGWANELNKDYLNINIDRDYKPNLEWDIAIAKGGYKNLDWNILHESKWIEVWHIFQLGYHYSKKMNLSFIDKDGTNKFIYMGCYWIWIDRTMATIVEKFADEKWIVWPENIAPYKIHLIGLGKAGEESMLKANEIYNELTKNNIEVLFDDRDWINPWEKFADSDLIGCPHRIVVSQKTLAQNWVELKKRSENEFKIIDSDKIVDFCKNL